MCAPANVHRSTVAPEKILCGSCDEFTSRRSRLRLFETEISGSADAGMIIANFDRRTNGFFPNPHSEGCERDRKMLEIRLLQTAR